MRFSVVHVTTYRYSTPVWLEPHVVRLRPREDETQRLLEYSLEIDPAPAGRAAILDAEGNSVTRAWFEGQTDSLVVRAAFTVETLRENPFDFLLLTGDAQMPVRYPEASRASLAQYLGGEQPPAVRDFARALAERTGRRTMDFLSALNRELFETLTHLERREGAPEPPERTLRAGAGSCRDAAVLFCSACRAEGIAARFVSGYEQATAHAGDDGELHAWAEAYLEGGGWRGFDPSRGLAAGALHVPVAAAAEPAMAAPVSGSFRGAAQARMEYAVSMRTV